jgi:hypothetical protein
MLITREEAKAKGIANVVKEHDVQFFDFGCSNGGSIESVRTYFFNGSKGMGFDISAAKLETAKQNHLVSDFDILDLPEEPLVNFTILFHILEHLDTQRAVERFLQKACAVSKDFVFLKQPFFDADPSLMAHGLKLYWSDWSGHPNRMTSLELYLILARLLEEKKIEGFQIVGKKRIQNSSCPQVLPLVAPRNQHDYDPDQHPPKRTDVVFDFPVFYELGALIEIKKETGTDFLKNFKPDAVIHST